MKTDIASSHELVDESHQIYPELMNETKLNTAILAEPRDEAWRQRHLGFVEEAQAGSIDVLFLGDSITDGWRDPAKGRPVWDRYFSEWKAVNFGISADRTQHVLWRLRHGEADGYHPKVVVLLIGTNNTGLENESRLPRNTAAEVISGILAVLEELHARFPEARILLFALFPRNEKDSLNRRQVGEINHALAKLSDAHISYLDIGDYFLDEEGYIREDLMPDKLHLSTEGYQYWAEAIKTSEVFTDWP